MPTCTQRSLISRWNTVMDTPSHVLLLLPDCIHITVTEDHHTIVVAYVQIPMGYHVIMHTYC